MERAFFLRQAGVEYDLQQQVADLVAKVVKIPLRDRVGDPVPIVQGGCCPNGRANRPCCPSQNPVCPAAETEPAAMAFDTIELTVNQRPMALSVDPDTPLLWVLREELGLTGTKFGCGAGLCGACTVLVDGEALRSCSVPLASVKGASVTTIEGLGASEPHAVQKAWIAEQVPQCGYCQSGMIMAAAALLAKNAAPSEDDIGATITNLCRCGTYPRVRRAILRAAAALRERA
jgi:isoquinoline 1-oxidoreductase subunit alpha